MSRAALLLGLSLASCSAAPLEGGEPATLRRFEERRVAMGVQARVVLFAMTREDADAAFAAAFGRIERIEAALSDWRPTSELSRLSDAAGGEPRTISPDLCAALERSLEIAKASGGAFDPTAGPLVLLWRKARSEGRPPDPAAIEMALALIGWEKLDLDPERRRARLAQAGMRLDLGAIGQGLACDEALAVLRARGFRSALVEIGGDLAAGDPPPGETGWSVAAGERVIRVANQGVATSGDAEQRLEVDGTRYSHVLDPRTGMGVTGGVATTVIARDGATADGLATAAGVLGARQGRALVESQGARILVDDPARRSLFDGTTLRGWVTKGGRYDGDARWTVEDGCIVGRVDEKGDGGLIYTEDHYASFVLECEVKLDHPFDSGIFLRMLPPSSGLKGAQVTLDDRPDGEIGAIYSDGFLMRDEAAREHWKQDQWNHVEVRCTGSDMRIEVWLNGVPVADHRVPASEGVYAGSGRIGLQVHGGMGEPKESAARFREIRLGEAP